MAEGREQGGHDGLLRLQSAAIDFARGEAARVAQLVVDDMRARSPIGIFGDLAARHFWDEYCWGLQEGPFDMDLDFGDVRLGSLSAAWDETLRATVQAELEKLPRHTMVFLSALAFEQSDGDEDAEDNIGAVFQDDVCKVIENLVNERASRRNLDLIGPNRADAIGYHIEGAGMAWRLIDDASDIISGHVDEMIDPDADLSNVANEMADQFIALLVEDDENSALVELLDRFASDIRTVVLEKDIIPSLQDMRGSLLEVLDE